MVGMDQEIILTAQDLEGLLTAEDQADLKRLEATYSQALDSISRSANSAIPRRSDPDTRHAAHPHPGCAAFFVRR